MSCFIVSDAHIDALVTAARLARDFYFNDPSETSFCRPGGTDRKILGPVDAQQVGQMLVNWNYKSVNARYNDSTEPHEYKFNLSTDWKASEIIKACHCYAYQSCEAKNWETSPAYSFIKSLESHMVRNLPGYDEAPWEITEPRSTGVLLTDLI